MRAGQGEPHNSSIPHAAILISQYEMNFAALQQLSFIRRDFVSHCGMQAPSA
jgi:hypothetical protein